MRLTVHLADAAQPDMAGKVSALGLGWSFIGTPMPPHALVLFVEVEPSEANIEHRLSCDLLDEDGQRVEVNGEVALHFDGELTVGAPPEMAVPGPRSRRPSRSRCRAASRSPPAGVGSTASGWGRRSPRSRSRRAPDRTGGECRSFWVWWHPDAMAG